VKATLASVGTSVVLFVLGTQLPGPAAAELLLTVSGSNIGDDVLRTIDSTDGSTVDASVIITLAGHTVKKATGLARHPQTGVLYALLRIEAPIQFPELVTLDEVTGVATSIGNTSDDFAGIAFGADGTLYAVSGDGGAVPEWLYTLDINDASGTLVLELGDGDDGETIAFNPDDGLLYHASGLGNQNNANVGEIFETIDSGTSVITNVPLSGFDYQGLTSLLYRDGAFFAGDLNPGGSSRFFRITTGGVVTFIGNMDHVAKGLAPVAQPSFGVPVLPPALLVILALSLLTIVRARVAGPASTVGPRPSGSASRQSRNFTRSHGRS
jgi:hypothetical protein